MPRTSKTPTTRKKAQDVPLLKITVQVWQRAAQRLEETLRDACFRRDAYLAKVIENELAWLVSFSEDGCTERQKPTAL